MLATICLLIKKRENVLETFIEILKVILPSCITGLITFWITRYTCQKNISLDKYVKVEVNVNEYVYDIKLTLK